MTPVLYILEYSLTSFQQWDFQWYNFNNVHYFNRDISYNSNAQYCIHSAHITQYILILHSTHRIQMLHMYIFGMNVAFYF